MSYTHELAEWIRRENQTKPCTQDKNTEAFLKVRDDVVDAIESGFAVKAIWRHMRAPHRIDFSSETFLARVRRHIYHEAPISLAALRHQQVFAPAHTNSSELAQHAKGTHPPP